MTKPGETRDAPMDEAALLAFLDAAGVRWTRCAHPPLHTVEESRAQRGALPGGHAKNLFLKDRNGDLVLAVCREDRAIRIRALDHAIGAKRLSFGSPDLLWETLGVRPGAVTPLALANGGAARAVRVILDLQLFEADPLNFHPLHNEATLAIPRADMDRFFASVGHAPERIDFDALEAASAAR